MISESPEGLSFGADVNAAKLLSVASKIQTFTERTSDANLMQEIENLIRESKRIVFLGFAYHSQNLKLIAVDELDKKDMLGTAFNVPKPNLEFIRYSLTQALKIKPRPPLEHGIILEQKRCKDLLNNHSHRLSS